MAQCDISSFLNLLQMDDNVIELGELMNITYVSIKVQFTIRMEFYYFYFYYLLFLR